MKILYSSGELSTAIKGVFGVPEPHDRRVALVAFVGGRAEAFLPDTKGLEIVCWLQPGATNADVLGRLQARGAKIFKSELLHMKVYWSSRHGCVICSANASGKALGGGNQKEAGVLLPRDQVDIEKLWAEAKPKPITNGDLKLLRRKSDRVPKHNTGPAEVPAEPAPEFFEWLDLPGRREWKLGWWGTKGVASKDAVMKARQTFGVLKRDVHGLNVKKAKYASMIGF